MNAWNAIREPNSAFAHARAFVHRAYVEATNLIVGAEGWSHTEDRFRDLIDAELVRLVERREAEQPMKRLAPPVSDAIPREKVQAIADKFADGELSTGALSAALADLLDTSPPVGGTAPAAPEAAMPPGDAEELVRGIGVASRENTAAPKRAFIGKPREH